MTLVDRSIIVQASIVLVPLKCWTGWGSEVISTHNGITMTTATDAGGSDRVQYNRWNEENINIDVAASQPGLVGWEFNVYETGNNERSTPFKENTKEFRNYTLTVSVNGGLGNLVKQVWFWKFASTGGRLIIRVVLYSEQYGKWQAGFSNRSAKMSGRLG